MFAAINKKQGLVLTPEMQFFGAPNGVVNPEHTFLFFATKVEAEKAASSIVSPKFKVVEVK